MAPGAFEWLGAGFGVLGSGLLALARPAVVRAGWLCFLAANIAMGAFAVRVDATGLLVQQMGFMATTVFGLYRTWWCAVRENAETGADSEPGRRDSLV